ncbi:MAG TPA: hypothetical protein VM925_17690 [Labilithrix sp.]|nr:hypothetical protein [Labilithrix sp.]
MVSTASLAAPPAPPPLQQAFEKLHKKLGDTAAAGPPSSRPALGAASETPSAPPDSPRGTPVAEPAALPSVRALAEDVGARSLPTEMLGSPSPLQAPSAKATAPLGALNLKPGTTALSPGRTPAAIAVVGGSSLRINAHAKQAKGGSMPPPVPTGRPSTAPKAFAPSGSRPPGLYDRGLRQWSSPSITTSDDSSGGAEKAPVTYQVYTAQDISAGRGPMRSIVALPPEPKKMSLGARVGIAAVGGVVVILTAAAVIAVSTEDPKQPVPTASARPRPTVPATATALPEPAPTSVSIGDPTDDYQPAPPPVVPTPVIVKPKIKPTPSAPASLKASSPPPNPYGK